MEPGYGGFADLGAMLMGGDQGAQAASFQKGALGRSSLETAMATAKIKRDEAMAREQLRGKLAASGMDPASADLLDTVMRGSMGSDFSAGQTGLGTGQRNNLRTEAMTAGKAGDMDLMNVLLAGVQGTPMTTTQIDEGYVVNPHGETDQNIRSTDGELADILANEALVGQRRAATGLSNDRAAQVRDKTANPDKYKPAPKTPKPKKGEGESETVGGAPKVGEVRKGYRFKGGDPGKKTSWEKV